MLSFKSKLGLLIISGIGAVLSLIIWIVFLVLALSVKKTEYNVTSFNNNVTVPSSADHIVTLFQYDFCPNLLVYNNCSTFFDYFSFRTLDGWGQPLYNTSQICNMTDTFYTTHVFNRIEQDYIRELTWLDCGNRTINTQYNNSIGYYHYTEFSPNDSRWMSNYYIVWVVFLGLFFIFMFFTGIILDELKKFSHS